MVCLCCVVLSWLCAVVANFVGLPVGLVVVWVFGVVVWLVSWWFWRFCFGWFVCFNA